MTALTQCKNMQTSFLDISNNNALIFERKYLKERSQINMSQLILPFNINEWQKKMQKLDTKYSLSCKENELKYRSIVSLLKRFDKKNEIDKIIGNTIIHICKKSLPNCINKNNQSIKNRKYSQSNNFSKYSSNTSKGCQCLKNARYSGEEKRIVIPNEAKNTKVTREDIMKGIKYLKKMSYFDFPIQEKDKVINKNSKTIEKDNLPLQFHKKGYSKFRDCKFPSFRSLDFHNENDSNPHSLKPKQFSLYYKKKDSIHEIKNLSYQQNISSKIRKHRLIQLKTFGNMNISNNKMINHKGILRITSKNSKFSCQFIRKKLNQTNIDEISKFKDKKEKVGLKNISGNLETAHFFKNLGRYTNISCNR